MTVDAFLSFALAIAIPFLLAGAGGFLATRTLPKHTKRQEFWCWIGVFSGLLIVGIVLGVIQQVRLATQQHEAEKTVAAEKLRNEGNVKYTQGQLDSINKVLVSVVNSGGTNGLTASLLKGALKASEGSSHGAGVEPPAIQRMTNAQLRQRVIDFANEMRRYKADQDRSQDSAIESEQQKNAKLRASGASEAQIKQDWDQSRQQDMRRYSEQSLYIQTEFVGRANEFKDELDRRSGPQPMTDMETHLSFWYGGGIGNFSSMNLQVMADYFERMARLLPK
jgi:hypothetical protein